MRVAGVSAPAFVERSEPGGHQQRGVRVSPGSRPRPSLSDHVVDLIRVHREVSPGSRPRPSLSVVFLRRPVPRWRVSPGSRPRPSLSAVDMAVIDIGQRLVSPGSRPRPSLSEEGPATMSIRYSVSPGSRPRPSLSAGSSSGPLPRVRVSPRSRPRPSLSGAAVRHPPRTRHGVAGVSAPAFVERARSGLWARCGLCGRRVSAPLTLLRRWQDDKA